MNQTKWQDLENIINKEYQNTTGLIIQKDQDILYEHYFNGRHANTHQHIFSATKSIISLLIGIALDKGYIKNVQQKVLDFFPDYQIQAQETTLQQVTIEDLLTMRVPYKFDTEPYIEYFTSDSWVNATLDLIGGQQPIGGFRYAAIIGPDVLSAIITITSGMSVLEFAREYLFTPLNIRVKDSIIFTSQEEQMAFYEAEDISGWVADPKGINTAGWGLTLTTSDMIKIGQLYLHQGVWNNQQIVSTEWLKASTTKHNQWQEMQLSYGYLWWLIDDCFAAMGDGGNVIYVNPHHHLVVAMTGVFVPADKDRIDFIKNYIEPLID